MTWNTHENTQRGNVDLYSRFDQATGRFAVAEGRPGAGSSAAPIGRTRDMVRMWDSYAPDVEKPPVPASGWVRGALVRWATPVVVLTTLGPVWDPSNPATWRPGL